MRVGLHRLGFTFHVHQDHAGSRGFHHVEHPRVRTGGDVVHDRCAGGERVARNLGLACVDRDQRVREVAQDPLDHRENAGSLFVGRDEIGPRPGRLPAHIEHVRAVSRHLESVLHRDIRVEVHTGVRERVRGDVHDAHDQRALAESHLGCATSPDAVAHCGIVASRRTNDAG